MSRYFIFKPGDFNRAHDFRIEVRKLLECVEINKIYKLLDEVLYEGHRAFVFYNIRYWKDKPDLIDNCWKLSPEWFEEITNEEDLQVVKLLYENT